MRQFQFVADLSLKTKTADKVLSDLSERASKHKNDGNCAERQINDAKESCCTFDETKLEFDSIFGETVSKIEKHLSKSNQIVSPTPYTTTFIYWKSCLRALAHQAHDVVSTL